MYQRSVVGRICGKGEFKLELDKLFRLMGPFSVSTVLVVFSSWFGAVD